MSRAQPSTPGARHCPTPPPVRFAPRTARSRMASTLELVLLYLAAAIAGVVAFRMLRLPPVLGYLVAGVIIGAW